jgi:hypothetical protein
VRPLLAALFAGRNRFRTGLLHKKAGLVRRRLALLEHVLREGS